VFPILLTPFVYFGGLDPTAPTVAVIALAALALLATYVLFRRLAGHAMALTVLCLTAVSEAIWFCSQSVLSEMPYLLVSCLALLLVETYRVTTARALTTACVAGMAIGVVFLTRTVGLAVLAAGVAYIALERTASDDRGLQVRLVKAAVLAAVGALPAFGWFARSWVLSDRMATETYLDVYGLKDLWNADARITGLGDVLELLRHQSVSYATICARILLPYSMGLPENLTTSVLMALVTAGFAVCLFRRRTVLEYYVPPYMVAVLLMPKPIPRYLAPIVPMVWYYFLVGLRTAAAAFGGAGTGRTAAVYASAVLVLAGANLASTAQAVAGGWRRTIFRPDVVEERYVGVLDWVERNTPPDSVFMWSKGSLRYLSVQRRYVPLPLTTDKAKILRAIDDRGVNYVAVDSFSGTSRHYLLPAIDSRPDRFRLVYESDGSSIYRVLR
jgi:hypothetical protein